MGFFDGVTNWFRGVFGGNDDDEERKRREQQQRQQQNRPKQPQIFKQPQQNNQEPEKIKNVTDLFNKKPETPKLFQQQEPETPAPVAPRVQYAELRKKAQAYQQPKVQDVNNYYNSDLQVLNEELAKGDKADVNRIRGVMQSLDNRKKELQKFHEERGKSDSFKSARELENRIRETRGDWTKENDKLGEFWQKVGAQEADDFISFLQENQGGKPARNWRRGENFTGEEQKVAQVKQEQDNQEVANKLLSDEYREARFSRFGNSTAKEILDYFNAQDATKRRKDIVGLANAIQNEDTPEDLKNQATLLYILLDAKGNKDTSALDKVQSFSDTAADKIGGGFGRSVPRTIEWLIPGKETLGTGALTDAADEWDRRAAESRKYLPDQTAADVGATAGSIVKGFGDLGLMLAGSQAASNIAQGTKLAQLASKGGTAGKVATRVLPDSLAGSGIDVLQTVGRGDEVDVPKSVGVGLALDLAADTVASKYRPVKQGLKKFFGRGVDDVVEGIEGTGTAITAASKSDDIVDGIVEKTARTADNVPAGQADDAVRALDDLETPTFIRNADDAKRAAETLAKQVDAADPLAKPTYLHNQDIKNVIASEEAKLNRFLDSNPGLSQAQIEAAREAAQQRTLKLIEDLQASRAATLKAVDDQAQATEEALTQQAQVNQSVKAEQAAQSTPPPGEVVQDTPVVGSPEIAANDAYNIDSVNSRIDELTDSDKISSRVEESTNPLSKFFNKTYRKGTNKYRELVDEARAKFNDLYYEKGVQSQNGITSGIANAPRFLFDKFGMKDAGRTAANLFESIKGANASRITAQADEIANLYKAVDDPQATMKRLYQVFEDPEFLARVYGEGTPKLTAELLTPAERAIYDRVVELNKVRNDIWGKLLIERRKAGLLDDASFAKQWQNYLRFQDGMHSPRIYDFELEDMGLQMKGNSNAGAFKRRKDLEQIDQGTLEKINEDPVQSMLFRLQTGMDELGRVEALNELKKLGYIQDAAPNKNWSKLEGGRYGSANGKYVDNQVLSELEQRQIFNSKFGQSASDLLDVYRNSVFGKLDRAVKKSKTVYSPGTFLGNLFSNPLFFNRGSGVDAVTQSVNMARNVPTLARHTEGKVLDPDILDMQRLGVKIGYTADELVGAGKNFRVIADDGAMKTLKDVALIPNKVYAGADDLAKVSIYKTLKQRGLDSQTAALRAAQFTQDYGNAGRAVQMLADSPVLGQPFARFVPELVRLTKNNILYNPVGTFAGLFGLAKLQQKLSQDSGETPEERTLRESAPGKVKIPFSAWVNQLAGGEGDISLDFPVNGSAINAARALGFNFPQEPGASAEMSLIKNLAPFAIPFMEGEEGETQFQPQQLVSSMLLKPLAEQVANTDFMGRFVDDPLNKKRGYRGDGFETSYSDDSERKVQNRLYHLFMNYSPLSNEADAFASGTGFRDWFTKPGTLDEGKDYYGKDRTLSEAGLRSIGVKVESNDPETRKERVERDQYFNEELPETQQFLRENPDLRDSYWNLKSTSKDRDTLVKANDLVSPERYQIIQADKSGRLYNFLKQQAIKESERKGKPLNPLYTLPDDQARQVVQLKAMNTGDDMKFQQLLYKEPWFNGFKEAEREFYNNQPEFNNEFAHLSKDNPRPEQWYNLSEQLYSDDGVVTQFPLVQQYKAKINSFDNYDSQERKDFTKAWYDTYGDTYNAQKEAYEAARLAIVNQMREIEGVPPLSPEVWSGQFETDEDKDGYGYGYGYGGGGGSRKDYTNTLGKITNFSADVPRLNRIEPAAMPALGKLFAALQAGRGGGKTKPRLGASSKGR